MKTTCICCGTDNFDKNTIGINKKFFGEEIKKFYCMECLASYLDTTVDDIFNKIEEFKEDGCKLFD